MAVGQYGPEVILSGVVATPTVLALTTITVKNPDNTAATLYTDTTGSTTTSNVVSTDARGNLTFFAAAGPYKLVYTDAIGAQTLTVVVYEDAADLSATYPLQVNHGATAGTARPTGTLVEWTGSVTPTNAVSGDRWFDTTNLLWKRHNGTSFQTSGSFTYVTPLEVTANDPSGTKLEKVGIVLGLGTAGTFDADRVESPCVFLDPKTGRYAMTYTGYGTDTGAERASIGLAYSDDLIAWTKAGQIFARSSIPGTPDENGATGSVIVFEDGVYNLFYIGLTTSGYEGGTKRLCHATATSLAGPWTRNGAIISPSGSGWRNNAIWHPSIVKRLGTYYLFFNATGDVGGVNKERIGYATATSLAGPWTVDDVNSPLISPGTGWESGFVGDPFVRRMGDLWRMDYYATGDGGASDGYATTTDTLFPLGWTKFANNPILRAGAAGSIDELYAHKPWIVVQGDRVFHYYTAVMGGDTNRRIALAVNGVQDTQPSRADYRLDAGPNWAITSTSYTRRSTAMSITLRAKIGDIVEVGLAAIFANEAVDGQLDVASIVAGAPVNYWAGSGSAGTFSGACWFGPASRYQGIGGSVMKEIVASDIYTAGPAPDDPEVVLLSLYGKTDSAGTKVVLSNATNRLHFWAKNHGPINRR